MAEKEVAGESSPPQIIARFPGGWAGAGGMVHAFNRGIYQQAADLYVRRYYLEHDAWPDGQHVFAVTFGIGEGFDVRTPIGTSSGTTKVTITFDILPLGAPLPEAPVGREDLQYLVSV